MTLAKDQLIKIITDAGKIPVERDIYYNPLTIQSDGVVGKIPYLNSAPFYHDFEKRQFRVLPVAPKRMGILAENGSIDVGLFSLVDYRRLSEHYEMLEYCIATRDQVKSVLLFSNDGWRDLEGRTIGISDETATSVKLLQVLLEKKYNVHSRFVTMHAGVNDYSTYDAVLLIGDDALRHQKTGLHKFELRFDLASEWYEWQQLPFVFAVWAVKRSLDAKIKNELISIIAGALATGELDFARCSLQHARRIGLSVESAVEYLEGFNYRLGERERLAIERFVHFLHEIEIVQHS